MGEVYRARDTQLDRDVAVKVLPDLFAADPDRLMRFEREAKTLAALNHPNIAQIYGLERSGQVKALVMELIEGIGLDGHMRGPLPLEEALAIARQMAEALEFAHERGIVHRDLKPANVMLTPDGSVKVLDFGLAKALEDVAAESGVRAADQRSLPTITSPAMTGMGVILGTAAYMAPEQAKGKPVDRRGDIHALGVVLFEMLSGRQMYSGETVTETIAQVITQAPDWNALPASTPTAVRRILRRCLEKDPRKRFQSAGDVRIEIEDVLSAPKGDEPDAPAVTTRPRWKSLLPWGLAAGLVIALASVLLGTSRRAADPPPLRLEARVGTGELVRDANKDGALVTLSSDGRMMAYAATTAAGKRLFVRALDSLESRELAGTDNVIAHTFSPDGRWIAFLNNAGLSKVGVTGGAPTSIASALDARGLTWGSTDTIVYAPETTTGLFRVSAGGGQPVQLTKPLERERSHRWPWFLPDGKTVIFSCQMVDGGYDDGTIEAIRTDQETPQRKVLIRGGTFPRYLASGHLTYMRQGTLFVAPFDLQRLEVTGTAQPVLTGITAHGGTAGGAGNGAAQIAFSDNGTAVYMSGDVAEALTKVVIMDRAGKVLHETKERGELRAPRFSPDGSEVAFQARLGGAHNVYVWNPSRGALRKVTFEKSLGGFPIWSPDSNMIAYFSDRGGIVPNVFMTRSDGAGEPEKLTQGHALRIATSFSSDAARLLVMEQAREGFDVGIVNVADKKLTPFLATPAQEMLATFSPDGRWIAYQSDESGTNEVYVRPYPGPGAKWQLSAGGGGIPVWTKSGRELLYLAGVLPKVRIMAVEVSATGAELHYSAPKPITELVVTRLSETTYFDATADGSRLAVLQDVEGAARPGASHIIVVLNFFAEVRRAFSTKP